MLNMGGMFGLGIVFQGIDNVSKVMGNIQRNMRFMEQASGKSIGNLAKTMGSMTGSIAMAATGAAGLKGSFALAHDAGHLESALAGVRVIAHSTDAELNSLSNWALREGTSLGYTATQSASGMQDLASAGEKTNEILRDMPWIARFASANMMDLSKATGISMQALNGFSLAGEKLPWALDQAQTSLDIFSLKAEDLELGIARGAAGMNLAGASLTDFLVMFGLAKNVLASPMQAGTGAAYAAMGLTNPKKLPFIEQQLGIKITDGKGGYRKTDDVFTDFYKAVEKMSDVDTNKFFRKGFDMTATKAISAMMSGLKKGLTNDAGVVVKGVDAIRYAWDKMMRARGTVEAAVGIQGKTFEKRVDVLSAKWDAFRITLGEPMKAMWLPIIDTITKHVVKLTEAFSKLSPQTQQLIGQIAVFGSAGAIVAGAILTLGVGWGFISFIFEAAISMLGGFLLAAWPVILVAGLIAAGFWVMNRDAGAWGAKLRELFTGFEQFTGTLDNWGKTLRGFWDGLVEGWNYIWEAIDFNWLRERLGGMIESFQSLWKSLGFSDTAGGWFKDLGFIIGAIAGIIIDALGLLGGVAAAVFSGLAWTIENVVIPIMQVFGAILWAIWWVAKQIILAFAEVGHVLLGWDVPAGISRDAVTVHERFPDQPKFQQRVEGDFSSTREEEKKRESEPLPQASDMQPLSKLEPQVAGSVTAGSYFHGVMPALSESKQVIDYDKLAAACAKFPINCVLDGTKIVGYMERAGFEHTSRENL